MANKIIRTPTRAEGGITPEEKALMDEHAASWIANAIRTDTVDRVELTAAIKDLYAVSGLDEPIVVIVPSPRVMAFASGFASAIWYLREHGKFPPTRSATYSATRSATANATANATYSATANATDNATYSATRSATYSATRSATDNATDRAITNDSELFAQIACDILGPQYALFGLQCAQLWYRCYQGGNMWSAWDCYLTAARDILGLKLAPHAAYAAWERCAKAGGFRFVHKRFCMVSDFPERLRFDEQNRPHSSDGPSHRWRDGWELYFWHGVRVTRQIVMAPETLTVAQIEGESNAEVRRVMIERFGAEHYIRESGAECVHSLPDDYFVRGLQGAKLYRKPRADDTDIVMVELVNSTAEPDGRFKRYMLRVDPRMYDGEAARNCHAAAASTWRDRKNRNQPYFKRWQEYAPAVET